jgi:hypothetical protein
MTKPIDPAAALTALALIEATADRRLADAGALLAGTGTRDLALALVAIAAALVELDGGRAELAVIRARVLRLVADAPGGQS